MQLEDTLFVLVHDAWHGAWFWEALIARVEERGGQAVALDLPGHGLLYQEEETPGDYSLAKYARAVEDFVEQQGQGRNVVLVGHGTAGPVLQLVAEQAPNKIAGLIFTAAYVLNHGESIASQMPAEMADVFKQLAESRPDRRIPLDVLADYWRFNVINDEPRRADEVLTRLQPEPLAPLLEPIQLQNSTPPVPCAYIGFNEDLSLPPGEFFPRMARKLGKYRHLTVNAGHEAPFTKPREVAEALLFLGLSSG